MPLNPAFDSGTTRKLPLAFGYVYGQGDTVLSTVAPDGSQLMCNLLGEGEWDGVEMANSFAKAAGSSTPAVPAHLVRKFVNDGADPAFPTPPLWQTHLAQIMHFHSGAWSTKGIGLQTTSVGPDQGYDSWWTDFPQFTPPQCFSGVAYAIWRAPVSVISLRAGYGPMTVSGAAIWRSTRCRMFDASGNVTSYGFTCNPAWHKVETILRYKIKPQQPGLAGLTDAEKACFDWESIAELAARNDYILPNGNPRFVGNYIFAADGTLADKLEIMQRVDRSFLRVQGGKVYMIGNDTRASLFLMGANHIVPGTVKLQKKDISRAPNVFIPAYRDLGIPAVSEVVSVAQTSGPGEPLTFTLDGPDPFLPFGVFTYGGCSDPSLDGDWNVGNYIVTDTSPPNLTPAQYSGTYVGSATGGYLGSNDARFSQRAPTTVQHRSAQMMTPQQAPGVPSQPAIRRVRYDCGASTYDQTNRLMKFERDSTLGTDIGDGWTAPVTGTLTADLEAVDANGQALIERGVHDVISLDDWACPEQPGDYEIMNIRVNAPAGNDLGSIELELRQYNSAAPTDISDPPGDSYQDVPNDGMALGGFAPVRNKGWVLQATPECAVAGDGSLTITVPDLLVHHVGDVTPTAYPTSSWTRVPNGAPVLLYIDTTGGSPVFTTVPDASLLPWSAGLFVAFSGTFTPSSGPLLAIYEPTFPVGM